MTDEPEVYIDHGRCKSGRRWFWYAAVLDYDYPRCDDPVCDPGLHPHEYGWEDTEDLALKAKAEAAIPLGGEGCYRNASGSAGAATRALKRINAAKRRTRSPSDSTDASVIEYLYEAYIFTPDQGDEIRGVKEWQIARRTDRRIYFIDGTFVSREELETGTRCQTMCPRTVPATVCRAHEVDFPHCIHWGGDWTTMAWKCAGRPGCGQDCPLDAPGMRCALHSTTRDHCQHNENPCRHGYPVGEMLKSGRGWWDCAHLFATREAAEEYLYGWEREQQHKRAEREPELRHLRMAMADAHPDRGGTNEEFIAAREKYERALKQAS